MEKKHQAYENLRGYKADFRVRYRFYSKEEGGRKSGPPVQGLRCNMVYDKGDIGTRQFGVHPEFEDENEEVITDKSKRVAIEGTALMWVTSPEMRAHHYEKVKLGRTVYFTEGSTIVAEAEIIQVLDLKKNPDFTLKSITVEADDDTIIKLIPKELSNIYIENYTPVRSTNTWWEGKIELPSGAELKDVEFRNMSFEVRTDIEGLKELLNRGVDNMRIYPSIKPIPDSLNPKLLPKKGFEKILLSNGIHFWIVVWFEFVTFWFLDEMYFTRMGTKLKELGLHPRK